MRNQSTTLPFETLETRRLFARYVLDVDRTNSPITVSATADGQSLRQTGNGNTFVDGMTVISSTKRGVSFSDNNNAGIAIGDSGGSPFGGGTANAINTGIRLVDADGRLVTLTFDAGDGQEVSVQNPSFGLDSGRVKVTSSNRFSTRAITAQLDAGTLGVSGVALPADLGGATATLRAATGRLKQSGSSVRATVPFRFTIDTNVFRFNRAERLELTFSGTLVAVGATATSLNGSVTNQFPVNSGIVVNTNVVGTNAGTSYRVASDLFG